jgi:hypothetical protein
VCAHCSERWEAELQLTAQFGVMRASAAVRESPDSRRRALLQEFSHRQARMPIQTSRAWVWTLGTAAALVFAVFVGHEAGRKAARTSASIQTRGARVEPAVLYEADAALSSDASALSSDDFVAVPYTPPLAPGEMVRIVRADLYPETLASMGVRVDPSWVAAWAADLPVEMVVGEDGIPRAVRITENNQF